LAWLTTVTVGVADGAGTVSVEFDVVVVGDRLGVVLSVDIVLLLLFVVWVVLVLLNVLLVELEVVLDVKLLLGIDDALLKAVVVEGLPGVRTREVLLADSVDETLLEERVDEVLLGNRVK